MNETKIRCTPAWVVLLSVVAKDFNDDGFVDLAAAMTGTSGFGLVGVFLGNGNGTFRNQTTLSLSLGNGSNPVSIAVAESNDDNSLDIAVGNAAECSISFLVKRCI